MSLKPDLPLPDGWQWFDDGERTLLCITDGFAMVTLRASGTLSAHLGPPAVVVLLFLRYAHDLGLLEPHEMLCNRNEQET